MREDDRLIGWAKLSSFEWTHGTGEVSLGIGAAGDRGKGCGSDALRLALRFAFDELNLHRLRAIIPGFNAGALRFFQKFDFAEEVRRRQALLLNGQRYDEVWFGLLRREWRA
jgi:RimJ/RimL family protein N-acetyltransferase